MKKSKLYDNRFPDENLLPNLDEHEIEEIVLNCDYTTEANEIAETDFADDPNAGINIEDAVVFYKMGYEAAQKRIEHVLIPASLTGTILHFF